MTNVAATTGLGSVSAADRARVRILQQFVESPEYAQMLEAIKQVHFDLPFLRMRESRADRANDAFFDSVGSITPRPPGPDIDLHFLLPRTAIGNWIDGLSIPSSVEGLQYALRGFRNALRALLNIGSYLRQLANTRDRHGLAPGKAVTIHPQVTRGPNIRSSMRRSSADLVSV
ncbi:hypothetical protein [Rhodococcus sp. 27YEA6]|uniref:hypothetical protein n=1 Tax=Rhodococcus sp. 27YEA6 TaxID=3156273 RepID=UPI003837CA42